MTDNGSSRFPTSKICFPRCLGRIRRSGRVRGLRGRLGDFRLKSKCIFNQISLPPSAFANAAAANVNTIQGPSRPRPRRQAPPTTTTTSTGCVHTYLIYVKALAWTWPCVFSLDLELLPRATKWQASTFRFRPMWTNPL